MAITLNQNEFGTKKLPLAAIREGVVFPHVEMVLTFGRSKSVAAVKESFSTDKLIVLTSQKRGSVADPEPDDLYRIGVIARIERTLKSNDEINALVKGIQRVRLEDIETDGSFLQTSISPVPELEEESAELDATAKHVLNEFKKAVNLGKNVEFLNFMKLVSGVKPSELADQIAATLDLPTAEKQDVLATNDVKQRLELVLKHLSHEVKVLEIEKKIASKTQKKFDKSMREAVLRERMKTIQSELGEGGDETQEIEEFKKKIKAAGMPKDVKQKVDKELKRFARLNVHSPEYSYIRTWLETIVDMPWSKHSKQSVSIKKAEKVLDKEHYALKEVKERIVEYLSVLKLKDKKGKTAKDKNEDEDNQDDTDTSVPTILCFVGPPGVGKTSIGRSIAKALGREFIKISLGGIRDEAEIRGHRRTYVGAMPGRIIQGIRNTETKNPVFMLDEIDKLGQDFRGDPSSALLEALDPEQNHEFSDHYLEVPFDLSQVIFITTANVLNTIPPALRDRLEIIEFSGYTDDEKYQIAKRHLFEKSIQANGLSEKQVQLTSPALKTIIKNYTREAGVRNLERQISKSLRKVAKKIAAGDIDSMKITKSKIKDLLGPRKFSATLAEKKDEIGLATGLAWTKVGGDIIFVEVATMPGKGNVVLTGQLGDVMQESAKAAWSYVRSNGEKLGLEEDFHKKIDVHVHVPEGAVKKDGPSAGVTMTTALVSALTRIPAKKDIGMTGEITLRGRVLEIGGIKEKVIAGHRAGLKEIIMPKDNKKNMVDIPKKVQDDIKFHFVETADEVIKLTIGKLNEIKKKTKKARKKKNSKTK